MEATSSAENLSRWPPGIREISSERPLFSRRSAPFFLWMSRCCRSPSIRLHRWIPNPEDNALWDILTDRWSIYVWRDPWTGFKDKALLFRRRNIVESALYVKKKWGAIYGALGMRYGREGCAWLQIEWGRGDDLLNWWELHHFWSILDGPISWAPRLFFYYEAYDSMG